MPGFSVAIDGPGGAGKSTAARLLAKELGFIYIDTGAMYRAVALFCIKNSIPCDASVEEHLDEIDIRIIHVNGEQRIFLGEDDVSEAIRTQQAAEGSSKVAVFPGVREKLVKLQRRLAEDADIIMDGRDIGTHVLPFANVKIYLDAGVEHRARRRQAELFSRGITADFEQTKEEVILRDQRDINREFSPLRRADDAVLLDTSDMTLESVVACIMEIIDCARMETKKSGG